MTIPNQIRENNEEKKDTSVKVAICSLSSIVKHHEPKHFGLELMRFDHPVFGMTFKCVQKDHILAGQTRGNKDKVTLLKESSIHCVFTFINQKLLALC